MKLRTTACQLVYIALFPGYFKRRDEETRLRQGRGAEKGHGITF